MGLCKKTSSCTRLTGQVSGGPPRKHAVHLSFGNRASMSFYAIIAKQNRINSSKKTDAVGQNMCPLLESNQ